MPSQGDTDVTDRMIKVGEIIDVAVVEHLIISSKAFFSFHETGLMDRLRASDKYALAEHEIIKIRKEAEKIGLEKGIKIGREEGKKEGRKLEKIEMAREMKKKEYPIGEISELTGLSSDEIEAL